LLGGEWRPCCLLIMDHSNITCLSGLISWCDKFGTRRRRMALTDITEDRRQWTKLVELSLTESSWIMYTWLDLTLIYATIDEADAYRPMFYIRLFLFLFSAFPSVKNMRQPFSGTAERIFMKLLPNDTGENGVSNVVPPPGEWLRISLCWFMLVRYMAVALKRHERVNAFNLVR